MSRKYRSFAGCVLLATLGLAACGPAGPSAPAASAAPSAAAEAASVVASPAASAVASTAAASSAVASPAAAASTAAAESADASTAAASAVASESEYCISRCVGRGGVARRFRIQPPLPRRRRPQLPVRPPRRRPPYPLRRRRALRPQAQRNCRRRLRARSPWTPPAQVSAVVGDEQVYLPALSPDGAQIAWFNQTGRGLDHNGQICLLTFDTAAQQCYPFPAGEFLGYPYQLQWSPDNSRIAFSENPIQLGYDSDIWVLTVADGSYANLTNDDVTGDWVTSKAARRPRSITCRCGICKTARSISGALFRKAIRTTHSASTPLLRTAARHSEVRPVSTEYCPTRSRSLTTSSGSWTVPRPSRRTAPRLRCCYPPTTRREARTETLWLLDLTQAATAPLELMTAADFQTALPSWAPFPAQAMGLSWTADGDGRGGRGAEQRDP